MFCSNCGVQSSPDSAFCSGCGQKSGGAAPGSAPQPTPVNNAPEGHAPQSAPPPSQPMAVHTQPGHSHQPPQAPKAAAASLFAKHKIPIIAGAAGLVAVIVLLFVFLGGGGNVVGMWELTEMEEREYFNGRLEWSHSERAHPDNAITMEFHRDGWVTTTEHSSWWGPSSWDSRWEDLGRGQMRIDGDIVDFRVRGNELRITHVDEWRNERWEYTMVFRRVR